MSSSKQSSSSRFWFTALASFILATLALFASAPVVRSYLNSRATYLADLSAHNKIDPVLGYRAAMALKGGGDAYRYELAERYIQAWKPQEALNLMDEPHKPSDHPREAVLRSRALMELDRGVESTDLAAGPADSREQLLLVRAAYSNNAAIDPAVIGNDSRLKVLATRVQGGGLPLAQELMRGNMPQAALRVLGALGPSIERERLTAQVYLDRPGADGHDIQMAREAVDRGLALESSNTSLHQLSRDIYLRQNDTDGADRESTLLDRLQRGSF